MTSKERYFLAHKEHFAKTYVNAFNDGHYFTPDFPKVTTSNGLTNAISNYMKWIGGIGNRINVQGRLIEGQETQPSGTVLTKKKWIKSSTIKGTADLDILCPNGKTIYIEIKVGKDKPSPKQLEMQKRVRSCNGVYEFVSTLDQFFYILDTVMTPELFR